MKHGHAKNGSKTPTYIAWQDMLRRCNATSYKRYADYGGRGIAVVGRWYKFENFLTDMGERPAGMTLERKDNDGNYGPDNCVWATRSDQQRNRRSNKLADTPRGRMVLQEALEAFGIHPQAYYRRIKLGWPVDRLFSKPRRKAA